MPSKNDVAENRRQLIQTIRETDLELIDLKSALKDVSEEITEHVAGYQESKDIAELKNQIETKKAQLNAKLSQDPDFVAYMDQKSGLNQQIGDAKEVLSTYVVAWKTLTGEDQVEYDEVMGKEVIVTGRLGKLERYQTSILTPPEALAKMQNPLQGMQDMADKHGATISIGDGKEEVVVAAPKRGRGRPKKVAE